jgi:hypothetical protein
MRKESTESVFYFIDHDGERRIPHVIRAKDGRVGYAIHPPGKGNDASAATYSIDVKLLVQSIVLHGQGARARRVDAKRPQTNTVCLNGRAIRGYWLCPSKQGWVDGASARPINEGV